MRTPTAAAGRPLQRSYTHGMRVAVLADIHSNLPALDAVLREVAAVGADAIVLVGNMTVGPLEADTLELLLSLHERGI
jgi:Icc-related predicted phosphoesterase